MIIGIGSRKRVGKDEVARYLVENHGFRRIAFADKLKEVAKVLFGWTDEHFDEECKEWVDPYWNLTPRKGLQLLGTEAGRRVFGHDIWIRWVMRHMTENPHANWVIPDVRFPDEARSVKGWGGVVWRVDRPGLVYGDKHVSETSMDDYDDWDRVIVNDGTIEDLHRRVEACL